MEQSKMTKKNFPLYFILVLVGFMALLGVVRAVWTNPSAAPPGGDPGPVPVTRGGTGAGTVGPARTNLGAAASGANSDITSMTGLINISVTGDITAGDLVFRNNFRFTETEDGIALINPEGTTVLVFDKKGNIWIKGDVKYDSRTR